MIRVTASILCLFLHLFRADILLTADDATGHYLWVLLDPHFRATSGLLVGLRVKIEFGMICDATAPPPGMLGTAADDDDRFAFDTNPMHRAKTILQAVGPAFAIEPAGSVGSGGGRPPAKTENVIDFDAVAGPAGELRARNVELEAQLRDECAARRRLETELQALKGQRGGRRVGQS